MDYPFVVTVVSQTQGVLDAPLVTAVTGAVASCGGVADQAAVRWLEPGAAFDLPFAGGEPQAVRHAVMKALDGKPADVAAMPQAGRRKKLLITDMDSTVITCECIDELGDMAGVKDRVAEITERAMNGELDFQAALTERVALLKGLPESVLQQVYAERVRAMPGAKTLLATMRAHGAYTVLVSGGFTYFTTRVRDDLGFDEERSNTLEIVDGVLTGRVIPPIIDKQAKLQALIDSATERGIALSDTLAAGDGANDLPMIQAAGLGVAYHAKAVVQASAGAALSHSDLTGLLYFQGYTAGEMRS